MATTTNYSWSTPDDTALVKDGAAAIRSLGTSVDTTTKNLNPSTTLGDIEYRSSTTNTNTRLAIGSTGNVLTVSGGVPVWAAPAGGGKVLQVIYASTTTETTVATTTYTDTTLSATITPSSATSKVLVLFTQQALSYQDSANPSPIGRSIRLLRGSTVVLNPDTNTNGRAAAYISVNTATHFLGTTTYSYLDSPSTTSATTYKTQGRPLSTAANQVAIFQEGSVVSNMILMEIGA
jgi:hypothetical protein